MNDLIFQATEQDFETVSELPVLIEFTADWCPPCKMLAPIMDEMAEKYVGKLRVGLLDSDEYPEIAQRFGVMGLPSMLLFVDGAPVERLTGFMPRERIEEKVLPYLT